MTDNAHDTGAPHALVTGDRSGDTQSVRHGYTIADTKRLTTTAAFRAWSKFLSLDDRHEIARFAIIEHLLTADERPTEHQLLGTAYRAITRHAESEARFHGIHINADKGEPGTFMPAHIRYWTTETSTRSPEDKIVDVTALRQIWPTLSRPHRTVLLALAEHDNYERAAAVLGRKLKGLQSTVGNARRAFRRLWHQHETPSGMWGHDNRRRKHPHGDRMQSVTYTLRVRARRQRARANPPPARAPVPPPPRSTPAEL